jgi:hypothetical protein
MYIDTGFEPIKCKKRSGQWVKEFLGSVFLRRFIGFRKDTTAPLFDDMVSYLDI